MMFISHLLSTSFALFLRSMGTLNGPQRWKFSLTHRMKRYCHDVPGVHLPFSIARCFAILTKPLTPLGFLNFRPRIYGQEICSVDLLMSPAVHGTATNFSGSVRDSYRTYSFQGALSFTFYRPTISGNSRTYAFSDGCLHDGYPNCKVCVLPSWS